jgi:hypothetical protein
LVGGGRGDERVRGREKGSVKYYYTTIHQFGCHTRNKRIVNIARKYSVDSQIINAQIKIIIAAKN